MADKTEQRKLKAEKNRIAKARSKVQKRIDAEPKLECTFVNLESEGVALDFTFEGIRYTLKDGQRYELPLSIIEHINSLKVPVTRHKTDPETGQLTPDIEIARYNQRFSVTPVNLAEYTEKSKELNKVK